MTAGAVLAGLVLGYGLGSIPFGLLLTRAAGLGDIRAVGSGNIGATNVLRTGSKGLAAATLLLDALKGSAAVWLGALLGPGAALAGALGAVLGHCFPAWLRFKGGKGVATYLGAVAALDWRAAAAFAAVWLLVAAATRYSSLAALIAVAAPPLTVHLLGADPAATATLAALAVLIWAKHRANVERLLAGRESRIGSRS